MSPDNSNRRDLALKLPIAIRNYYGPEVMKALVYWERHESWISVGFQGRVHRWNEKMDGWEPASACHLHRIYRQEWDGTTERPIDCGSYMVDGFAPEDAWDTILAALDPFYLAAYVGSYNSNYLAELESRLTHLRT